ncbi:MAG: ribosome biogenesis GTP-binding protein YihA/YsxC [Candidatus Eremiobacteraeota bacterium]|nr:ribosome biogenesis GTP-binding protein YihA/YsxC [Candidatus Eremiobacteraeota bacterium]MCW5866995.1 ribosome biogenesis GTP-binding protein YihA/YsxC [Candidatus Eremiobacteraeota bacterium]
MKISKAFLLGSAYHWEQMPAPELPEFGFIGRSNVGKSSLINSLVGQKKLAYTSNTPGKTRLMHFYMVNHQYVLVDLPGYGYAKVSQTDRAFWEERLRRYLKERPNLACALHLIDARHGPLENDLEMAEWMWQQDLRRCAVLTKVDKISKNAVARTVAQTAQLLRLDKALVLPVSAEKGSGRDELWRHLTSQKMAAPEP